MTLGALAVKVCGRLQGIQGRFTNKLSMVGGNILQILLLLIPVKLSFTKKWHFLTICYYIFVYGWSVLRIFVLYFIQWDLSFLE